MRNHFAALAAALALGCASGDVGRDGTDEMPRVEGVWRGTMPLEGGYELAFLPESGDNVNEGSLVINFDADGGRLWPGKYRLAATHAGTLRLTWIAAGDERPLALVRVVGHAMRVCWLPDMRPTSSGGVPASSVDWPETPMDTDCDDLRYGNFTGDFYIVEPAIPVDSIDSEQF